MSSIVDFYRGAAPDYLGRSLEDIWRWNHHRLEETHNYIQVLFPNQEPSRFNLNAPLLDQATIAAFRQDEKLRGNLATSLDVMLRFYGLEYQPQTGQVVKEPNFAERGRNWLTPYNHNYLRITRILKCLVALGLADRARAFFACLQELYAEYDDDIGPDTFGFWKEAVARLPSQ
jgi:Opioid growth factor receptor (OGFr) conserved region